MPGPAPSAHQVLVYSGPGVSPISLSHTLLNLSLLLLPHHTVQPASPTLLASEPWEPNCALLVIPGGRDLPYVSELGRLGVTRRIKEYVREGGRYLGICAGAYFGSGEVRFDVGGEMEIRGERELAFFSGPCVGPTFPGFAYAAESGARAVSLELEQSSAPAVLSGASSSKRTLDHLYYNGGGHFVVPASQPDVEVIARYSSSATSSATSTKEPSAEGKISAVLASHGKGRALLCSVHFEYPLNDPPAKDAIAKLEALPDQEELERSEKARIAWVEELLVKLELRPPDRAGRRNGAMPEGEEDPALLLRPTHPSPIFILPLPVLPDLGTSTFASVLLREKMMSSDDGYDVLRDGNDELRIAPITIFGGAGGQVEQITTALAKRRREAPKAETIPLEKLSIDGISDTQPPQPPDLNALAKMILLPSPELTYTPSWTPLFNFDSYWEELAAARRRYGKKSGVLKKGKNGEEHTLGDLVWYAETVTSTQTMLDRNPLLLTHLPSPLAFLASFQLTGRGRGSNMWLSPPGCLQFSLLLTLPSSLSSKLVFVQYLMALAVCEAVDDDGRLGVRIKWPNDLYADAEGVGGTEAGGGVKGRAKLGGILVNTNLVGGKWRLVVGCGFNVLNALPTTSLSQLHSLLAARTPVTTGTSKPLPVPPTMEGTFARIMNSFESKWEQFIEEKGFAGLLDEYYGRWLHSGQEVTLTTTEPHTRLRIQGITSDHGLLRCIPLGSVTASGSKGLTPLYDRGDFGGDDRSAIGGGISGNAKAPEYVDLQPDGNSFDMMSGLIKRKV